MQRKSKINKNEIIIKLVLVLIIGAILLVSLPFSSKIEKMLNINQNVSKGNYVNIDTIKDDNFVVHYINVGQADCTFIELPDNKTMLIDTGDTDSVSKWHITDYISALGVSTINYLVLTHSDRDHIGGAKNVLDTFEVENIYRPFALSGGNNKSKSESFEGFVCDADEDLSTIYNQIKTSDVDDIKNNAKLLPRIVTDVYSKTISSIYSETYTKDSVTKNANVFVNYDGIIIPSTDSTVDFSIKFYAPLIATGNVSIDAVCARTEGYVTKGYGATTATGKNAISPVIKFEYKNKKFVFTGDITTEGEEDLVASLTNDEKQELSNVDVYQAGHHGASNSNTTQWLNILKPTYTVVSCGLNNKYKHPTEEFLARIDALPHTVSDYLLRTDLQGTIVFGVSDDGQVAYSANAQITKEIFSVKWWHIAGGIFVVSVVIIFSIKIPKKYRK